MSLVRLSYVRVGHMQSQRQTMTDRLADVIHIIHIGGKSGVLAVEREPGEEGFITFVDGRVVEAQVGSQNGLAAFDYLNTWQACRFSLLTHIAHETSTPIYSTQPLPPITQGNNVPDETPVVHTAPLRMQSGEEVLQQPGTMQLPRLHRRLLLLIDGQRRHSDLARLMSRSIDEIQELLDDLERSGLIQQ